MSASPSIKRERGANFTEEDVKLLVSIIMKFSNIVEDKTTDPNTWQQKKHAWDNICSQFNASSMSGNRAVKMLRFKYDALKRTLRKKIATNRLESSKAIIPLTDYEEEIKGVISSNPHGFESFNDNDSNAATVSLSEEASWCSEVSPTAPLASPPKVMFNSPSSSSNIPVILDANKWKPWNPQLKKSKNHINIMKSKMTALRARSDLQSKYLSYDRSILLKTQIETAKEELELARLKVVQTSEEHIARMKNITLESKMAEFKNNNEFLDTNSSFSHDYNSLLKTQLETAAAELLLAKLKVIQTSEEHAAKMESIMFERENKNLRMGNGNK